MNTLITALIGLLGGMGGSILLEWFKGTQNKKSKFQDKYQETVEEISDQLSQIELAFVDYINHPFQDVILDTKRKNVYALITKLGHFCGSRRIYFEQNINTLISNLITSICSLIEMRYTRNIQFDDMKFCLERESITKNKNLLYHAFEEHNVGFKPKRPPRQAT